jgi:transposase
VSKHIIPYIVAQFPVLLVDIEACVGARHASRQLLALGHDVKLIEGNA